MDSPDATNTPPPCPVAEPMPGPGAPPFMLARLELPVTDTPVPARLLRVPVIPEPFEPLPLKVREACEPFRAELAGLAAEMLGAMEAAHEVLAPAADEDGTAGKAAGAALQILADAIASAKPPETTANV